MPFLGNLSSTTAPALSYYRPSMDISTTAPALSYYRPSDPHGRGKCGICKDQSSAMDICVVKLRNSPAITRIPHLKAELLTDNLFDPDLNRGSLD